MTDITFITGNQGKADFLARHLGHPVKHLKLDLDEIQSLDLEEVAGHKAEQAYQAVGAPVLVEDVALEIDSLGKLPGPFVKWFEASLGLHGMCKLVGPDRCARARVCFAYRDQNGTRFFHGELSGKIAESPKGQNGFGFDPIFIPDTSDKRLAEMNDDELEKYSLRTTTVYPKIREFLEKLDSEEA